MFIKLFLKPWVSNDPYFQKDISNLAYGGQRMLYGIVELSIYSVKRLMSAQCQDIPHSKAHGANTGPKWGRQDPGGPPIGPMNFAIWDCLQLW